MFPVPVRKEERKDAQYATTKDRIKPLRIARLTVDGASQFAPPRSRFPPPVWYLISASIIIT